MQTTQRKELVDQLAKALLMTLDAIEEPKLELSDAPTFELPQKKND